MLKLKLLLVAAACVVASAYTAGVIAGLELDGWLFGAALGIFWTVTLLGTIGAIMSLYPLKEFGTKDYQDLYPGIRFLGWQMPRLRILAIVYVAFVIGAVLFDLSNGIVGQAYGAEVVGSDDCHQGYEYVTGLTRRANQDLRVRGVHSLAEPSRLVADVVSSEAAATVLVIEHLSTAELDAATTTAARTKLVCVVLKRYADEGDAAYRTEGSTDGYYGRAQMTGGIYTALRQKYPRSGLSTSSITGRQNPLDSAKAVILHFDGAWAEMSAAARSRMASVEWHNRAMVAGYNLEASQVSRAIEKCDTAWRSAAGCRVIVSPAKKGKKAGYSTVRLPERTRIYLEMYLLVRETFQVYAERT